MTRFTVEVLSDAEREFRDAFHFHVLNRFPYTVWYDLNGPVATVVAIAHQHRRPNYWTTRD